MVDITARKQAEQELKRIQWLLKPDHAPGENYVPEYGNLLDLNTSRVILDAVGQEVVTDIVKDFLDLLATKEGYWIWILDRGKVIEWDESGNPLRMIGTYRGVKAEI